MTLNGYQVALVYSSLIIMMLVGYIWLYMRVQRTATKLLRERVRFLQKELASEKRTQLKADVITTRAPRVRHRRARSSRTALPVENPGHMDQTLVLDTPIIMRRGIGEFRASNKRRDP